MDVSLFLYITAAILFFAAFFGWINEKYLNLPLTIGLVVTALAASLGVMLLDVAFDLGMAMQASHWLKTINFSDSLMLGMLHFLLFAGALHVDLSELLKRKWHVLLMATLGLLTSTLFIGYVLFYLLPVFGLSMPLIWCFVFGSLISPTDPVAVLSILRRVKVPDSLKVKITGESLFNDGFAVVLFLLLLGTATGKIHITPAEVAHLFVQEVVFGVGIGLTFGYLAVVAMRALDEYVVEVIITLALVTGVYAVCTAIHASGPLGVVVAGLMMGNRGARVAMSEKTRGHVTNFWELVDEILNAALFLLIGFEILIIPFSGSLVLLSVLVILLVLLGRTIAVSAPLTILQIIGAPVSKGAHPVLIWGGLRGGISVALALSLPDFEGKDIVMALTYAVVIFSIIIQGLTMERLVRRVVA